MTRIVMIPGFSFGASFYKAQYDYLTKKGYDIAVYVPYHDSDQKTIVDILDRYPGKMHLVGQSMGGRIAFQVAHAAPDRVEKIVAFQPGPAAPENHPHMVLVREFVKALLQAIESGDYLTCRDQLCAGTLAGGPDIKSATVKLQAAMKELSVDQVAAQAQALLDHFDISSILPHVSAMTLIANSEQDAYYTESDARYLQQQIPSAAMTMLPGVGHGAMIQTPAMICALLRLWLDDGFKLGG